jgi:hypothetical protein
MYLLAVYFSVTTMTTVGYGDISASSSNEQFLACFTMVIGVLVFSYSTGTVAAILLTFDDSNEKATIKLLTLNEMKQDYRLLDKIY